MSGLQAKSGRKQKDSWCSGICNRRHGQCNNVQDTVSLLDIKNEIMEHQWGPTSHFLPHKLMQLQGTHSIGDRNSYEVLLHKKLKSSEIWGSHSSAAEVSGALERHCVVGLTDPNVSKLLKFMVKMPTLHGAKACEIFITCTPVPALFRVPDIWPFNAPPITAPTLPALDQLPPSPPRFITGQLPAPSPYNV
jgi:hypothetical protein